MANVWREVGGSDAENYLKVFAVGNLDTIKQQTGDDTWTTEMTGGAPTLQNKDGDTLVIEFHQREKDDGGGIEMLIRAMYDYSDSLVPEPKGHIVKLSFMDGAKLAKYIIDYRDTYRKAMKDSVALRAVRAERNAEMKRIGIAFLRLMGNYKINESDPGAVNTISVLPWTSGNPPHFSGQIVGNDEGIHVLFKGWCHPELALKLAETLMEYYATHTPDEYGRVTIEDGERAGRNITSNRLAAEMKRDRIKDSEPVMLPATEQLDALVKQQPAEPAMTAADAPKPSRRKGK